jgi:formylglycine-generating enzyme required for sulfatase activity
MKASIHFLLPLAIISCAALSGCGERTSEHAGTQERGSVLRTFNDCDDASWCPQMVALSGGRFVMGSPASEAGRFDDEPQHEVSVASFAIAKYPVTRGQWRAFVTATHRPTPQADCAYAPSTHPSWQDPGYPQTDDHPVVCITWGDAKDYVAWLSQRSGHTYRLLTNAEWEFAARAGTTTPFPWGARASHQFANYGMDECCGPAVAERDRWEYTSPVGSFPPNAFGLFDMHGNAFEWVEDCADADEHITLPSGTTGCTHRYARGGVYGDRPEVMRSAAKNFAPAPDDTMTIANYRSAGFGLRVARSLP